MKIRENTIIVKKTWGDKDSEKEEKTKIKTHFEKFGECQIYFGWLYTGYEGAEIEFSKKEMQEKALAEATDFGGFDHEAAPELPNQEEIEEMKKEMNEQKKRYKAALHATKNSGKIEKPAARGKANTRLLSKATSTSSRPENEPKIWKKPCRFGFYCNKKENCNFWHPKFPPKTNFGNRGGSGGYRGDRGGRGGSFGGGRGYGGGYGRGYGGEYGGIHIHNHHYHH